MYYDTDNDQFIVRARLSESLARDFETFAEGFSSESEALRFLMRSQLQREVAKGDTDSLRNPAARVKQQAEEAEES